VEFTTVLSEQFVRAKRRSRPEENSNELRDRELLADVQEEEIEQGPILRAIIGRYEWVLGYALDNRWLVLIIMVGVLLGSYLLYRTLGSEFLPAFDESAFVLDYWAQPRSSVTEYDHMLQQIGAMYV